MKTKILHISQSTGGVKTYVAHIINNADPHKFQFVMAAPENDYFRRFCEDRGITYYALDLHRGNNPFKNFSSMLKIIKAINKEKPDLIHAHSAKGGFLGRLAAALTNSKIVYTPHAFSYLSFTGLSRLIYFLLELFTKSSTNTLLAISNSEANRAIHELGFDENKIEVIPNSVPAEQDMITYRDTEHLNIRMIGRLTRQKNQMLFLKIAQNLLKKYPNLQFSILGAGIHDDQMETISTFVEENNMRSNFHIVHWGTDMTSSQFLKETDIYVMTSVFEGMPFSLLEAMALGVPCVVSKVDGNTDVINNNENGFACLSLEEFTSKIELLINDPALRAKLGTTARKYVENEHNVVSNTKKLEAVYRKVVHKEATLSMPVSPLVVKHT